MSNTGTLTPQQKAANTRKRNAFLLKIQQRHEEFRKDPQKLAGAIADEIEHDALVTDDTSTGVDASEVNNGQPHWNQGSWGEFKMDPKNFVPLPGIPHYSAVKCPTTACGAGWAVILAGYPMVIPKGVARIQKDFDPGDILQTSECFGPDGNVELITNVAARLLRLGYAEQEWLFAADRSQREVVWALREIQANGPSYFDPEDCPFQDS